MSIYTILSYAAMFVEAGFNLTKIVNDVRVMEAAGSTEKEIHAYLKKLAHDSQEALEKE
jgi:citrate lyase synthetase